jgi:hypothetical protein
VVVGGGCYHRAGAERQFGRVLHPVDIHASELHPSTRLTPAPPDLYWGGGSDVQAHQVVDTLKLLCAGHGHPSAVVRLNIFIWGRGGGGWLTSTCPYTGHGHSVA